jgi:hypothetical protein
MSGGIYEYIARHLYDDGYYDHVSKPKEQAMQLVRIDEFRSVGHDHYEIAFASDKPNKCTIEKDRVVDLGGVYYVVADVFIDHGKSQIKATIGNSNGWKRDVHLPKSYLYEPAPAKPPYPHAYGPAIEELEKLFGFFAPRGALESDGKRLEDLLQHLKPRIKESTNFLHATLSACAAIQGIGTGGSPTDRLPTVGGFEEVYKFARGALNQAEELRRKLAKTEAELKHLQEARKLAETEMGHALAIMNKARADIVEWTGARAAYPAGMRAIEALNLDVKALIDHSRTLKASLNTALNDLKVQKETIKNADSSGGVLTKIVKLRDEIYAHTGSRAVYPPGISTPDALAIDVKELIKSHQAQAAKLLVAERASKEGKAKDEIVTNIQQAGFLPPATVEQAMGQPIPEISFPDDKPKKTSYRVPIVGSLLAALIGQLIVWKDYIPFTANDAFNAVTDLLPDPENAAGWIITFTVPFAFWARQEIKERARGR